ncbi:TonB-dependent receptor [Aurantibacter crassamenti]|uniref:SusC/RagA family TonB-linked outer membrane protein n=1 Tax=Aurantibacter crassamenti TaxID=1837375 RepID=UPI00193A7422|nr:TonB-dependent receptor [Aurantibacter crassamenti]MBM1106539.1 TonB-dependent receptor [Aurantibacter crassamenti]
MEIKLNQVLVREQNKLLINMMRIFLFMCVTTVFSFTPNSVVFENNIQQQVNGTVLDQNGQPLPGANILEKGTTNGTQTDFDGNFSIQIGSQNATLMVSYLGFVTKEIEVSNQSHLDITLEEDANNLDEVVVVGYGTMKKSDLTGSVANVSSETYQDQHMTQITDMLQGTVAGLNMSQSSSASGEGSIEVRGANSLNASTQPMIVVDGSIYNGSIRDINPADVKSIDILKDASSAAVYGSRASSGVILITTKGGTKGKTTINFTSQLGVVSATNKFASNNAEEYLSFRQDVKRALDTSSPAYYYDNPNQLPDGVGIDQWRNASNNPNADNTREWLTRLTFFPVEMENYINGNSIDWYDKTIRSGAIQQKYDLSINGGTDEVTYFWSMGYQENEGILLGDDYSAITTRLNLNFKPTKWMDIGMNTQFTNRDEGAVSVDQNSGSNVNLSNMLRMSPYGSEYNEDGTIKRYPNDFTIENPLLNYYGQQRTNKINSLFSTLYTNIQLPFGIKYKLSFQPRFESYGDYNFWSSETIPGGQSGFGTREEYSSYNWIFDNILTWKKEFGKHSFDLTLLQSAEQNKSSFSYLQNEQFTPNENLGFHGLQYGVNPAVSTDDRESTADASMARLNYVFNDKYLLTASVRRDGYSAFGQENPRAVFPAVALAWKVSDEGFFNIDAVNQMKLRASWGINGNRDIDIYGSLAQTESDIYYDGTNTQVGVFNSTLANRSLRWEKTESLNFGLDLSLYQNRITFAADVYSMSTVDLLMERKLPEITGYESILANLGELQNTGVEFTLNTVNVSNENLTWKTNLTFALNRNKIKKLFSNFDEDGVELPDYTNQWFPGHAIDAVWDYKTLGIWQVDEAAAAAAVGLEPGDWKAEDVDGDNIYEELKDKQFIGNTEPRFRMGMRNQFNFLKNFTASVFLRGEFGQIDAFSYALRQGGSDTYDRRNEVNIPYWTPENPINDYPRLIANNTVYGGGLQIYKKSSFIRIQDVTLSYNVPSDFMDRYGISSARLFFSGHNLAYFSKWPGWDPESLNNPMTKTFSLGFSLTL